MQDYALKKALFDLVKLNARSRNGYTLLHLACTKDSATLSRYPICTFPSTDVIDLLLQVGADPDSVDQVQQIGLGKRDSLDLMRIDWGTGRQYGASHSSADPAVSIHGRQGDLGQRRSLRPGQLARSVVRRVTGGSTAHSSGGQPATLHHSEVSLRQSRPSTSLNLQLADTADLTTLRSQALITASSSRTVWTLLHSCTNFSPLLSFILLVFTDFWDLFRFPSALTS